MAGIGMTTGLRALLTARFGLDTVGHNISNATTPGYSRQRVALAATHPLMSQGMFVGTGVEALAVHRNVDALLHRRILGQTASVGSLAARWTGMSEMEGLFSEPENGLGGLMDDWYAKVSDLSAGPEDDILRTGLVASGEDLGSRFRQLHGQIGELRDSFASQLEIRIGEVNELARAISNFNREIGKTEVGGATANDLRDGRDEALRRLSELVDVKAIEDAQGVMRVIVSGSLIVDSGKAHEMSLFKGQDGSLALEVDGVTGAVPIKGGQLGGLYELYQEQAPTHLKSLDAIAHELIRGVNRAHAIGVPKSGPFESLTGSNRLKDMDGDGQLTDELLSKAGLPFEISSGTLYVSVTADDGNVTRHALPISATHTTVGGFLQQLDAVPHLSAEVDALGRLRIEAEAGYGFDFSRRLDPHPDDDGTFGGGAASLGSATGPFALSDGDTLSIDVGATNIAVTFAQSDFAAISAATASELADVINNTPGATSAGLVAVVVGDALYLQTAGTGASESLTVQGGSAAAALGLAGQIGTPVSGSNASVAVTVSGGYTGDVNDEWIFRPNGDGVIGTTPGLKVDVFDGSGAKIATLDVGDDYQPGQLLTVGAGVSVSFGTGTLSASHNDAFGLDVIAHPDTTDTLVALGLNSFFVGSDASDIGVREELRDDPDLIAASSTGAIGDAGILLDLLDVQDTAVAALDGDTVQGRYSDLVGSVGFEAGVAITALEANQALLDGLELRREEISGVNVDEEMVRMMQLEQSYTAAVQYIQTLNQLQDDLLNLL